MTQFRGLQRLLGTQGDINFESWIQYHWNNFVADFNNGIENLDLESNFKSFRKTVTVSDSQELLIEHKLNIIPSAHIVLNGVGGVIRGQSSWTKKDAYLILDSDLYTSKSKNVDVLILA